MTSFADMKKNRRKYTKKLQDKVKQTANPKNSHKDERFWELTVDNAGNGNATIRFLPASDGEDTFFVQTFSHGFQGPGGWYIENCLSTVGKDDPVNEMNSFLWEQGEEDVVRKRKRRLTYISNILVVNDPANPENNGKVFLYRYGKKIFDMINDIMFPEDEDEESVPVFCPWEGANFKLKAKKVKGYRNYDSSKFLSSKPIAKDDDKIEAIWKTQHKLKPFIDPDNSDEFKTYDQLKDRLIKVLGEEAREFFGVASPGPSAGSSMDSAPQRQSLMEDDDDDDDDVDVEDLDDDVVTNSTSDDDDEIPFDLDDDDEDLESFNDLVK